MRAVLALLVTASLAACSPAPPNLVWHKPGATVQAGQNAKAVCEGRVAELQALNPSAHRTYLDRAMQGCMTEQGYALRPA